MTSEQINAKLAISEAEKKRVLEDEFEKHSPKPFDIFKRLFGSFAYIAFVSLMFPDVLAQPSFYLLLLLILTIKVEAQARVQQAHKRMDTLYRLLKKEA